MKKSLLLFVLLTLGSFALADIVVSDVEVFSGYPWKEIVVGYTIMGTNIKADDIRLSATDHSANKTYVAKTLKGAMITEGRHVLRWDAAAEGVEISSTNVVFSVSVVAYGCVQLWEDGPYWAECNVGASKPEESGYYFRWGETMGYKRNTTSSGWISEHGGAAFSFNSEEYRPHGMDNSLLRSAGYIDSKGHLVPACDAATSHLGAPWRMPTDGEISTLISKCDMTSAVRNGVYGVCFTGRGAYSERSIFLPAAGYGEDSNLISFGSYGLYRSSTPYSYSAYSSYVAWSLSVYPNSRAEKGLNLRYHGQTVRPLRESAE